MSAEPRLTTHVLDAARGRPAAGVSVAVARRTDGAFTVVETTATDVDGRTARPLLTGEAWTAGTYELTFGVGDYFAGEPLDLSDAGTTPYLDEVPVRISVDGTEHVHVALLVTPWSYTTYRGS
jgi:hydroxyisourate hydrolase